MPIPPVKPGRVARWRPVARLLAAMIVTPTVLIYQWGLSLILGMMDGRPPPQALATLAAGIALVV